MDLAMAQADKLQHIESSSTVVSRIPLERGKRTNSHFLAWLQQRATGLTWEGSISCCTHRV